MASNAYAWVAEPATPTLDLPTSAYFNSEDKTQVAPVCDFVVCVNINIIFFLKKNVFLF